MKKTIIMAAVLIAMVGCNKTLIESPVADSDYGYINLGVTAETEMVVTKGVNTTADLTGYKVNLLKDGVQVDGWPKAYNELTDKDWKVPAGAYTVMVYDKARVGNTEEINAVYNTSDPTPAPIRGSKYIYGSGEVTVLAGEQSAMCNVNCTVQNSAVSFVTTEAFKDVFSSAAVTVKEKNGSRQFTPEIESTHDEANAVYFEPGTLTWTLTATPKLGGVAKTYSDDIVLPIKQWSQVTFSSGNTDGQINVTITVNAGMTTVAVPEIDIDPSK